MEGSTQEILKKAMLLEKRGMAFYGKVAEQAASEPVKEFFRTMAEAEAGHLETLSVRLKAVQAGKPFPPHSGGAAPLKGIAAEVLNAGLKKEIAAAGFEAAAISAAIHMEESAIRLYSERAESAADPEEKALFRWLASWERGHLDFLMKMDRELIQKAWEDSSFWPF